LASIITYLASIITCSNFIAEKPSAPGAPLEAIDITKGKVTLEWKPSPKDGGSPISGYIVESRESWKTKWTPAGETNANTCTTIVGKLKEGQEYYFRVCAENPIGKSEYLETSKGITPKSAHGKGLEI
jgi:titin